MKLLLLLTTPLILNAHEPVTLESGQVEYEGSNIIMTKQVVLENEVGRFQAEWVRWDEGKEEMELKENVECHFAYGMILKCNKADFFLNSLELSFAQDVHLSDETYALSGNKMQITLTPDHHHIQDFAMNEGVKCDFKNEYTLVADRAGYRRADGAPPEARLYGVLKLNKASDGGMCGLANLNGDRILADEIAFNFACKQLTMKAPCGILPFRSEKVEVVAGRLLWEQGIIQLQECVAATLIRDGAAKCRLDSDAAELRYEEKEGERKLTQVICRKETELTVKDRFAFTLTCYGEVVAEEDRIVMKSDKGKQIYFQDGLAKMAADEARLTFLENVLDKVILEGNVLLINRLTQLNEGDTPLQYALADTIEYLPKTKEISLMACGSERVLFLDRVNQLQISAPALKIKRTTGAQKGYIQGLGDVRFSFAKKEMDRMNELFPNIAGR